MSARQQKESRFARVVGTRFLAFLCAADESRLDGRLAHGRPLLPEHGKAVEEAFAGLAR